MFVLKNLLQLLVLLLNIDPLLGHHETQLGLQSSITNLLVHISTKIFIIQFEGNLHGLDRILLLLADLKNGLEKSLLFL
jgi:hypothetical protein